MTRQLPKSVAAPHDLFMVTDKGLRIPIDVKLDHISDDGVHHWAPVVEADLNAIMPSVIAFDGPPLRRDHCVYFATPGPGWDTPEWGHRVMANSTHVFGWYDDYDRRDADA